MFNLLLAGCCFGFALMGDDMVQWAYCQVVGGAVVRGRVELLGGSVFESRPVFLFQFLDITMITMHA